MRYRLWVALGGAFLASCGGPQESEDKYPGPGEMRVLSITPVGRSEGASLIPQSTFEEWYIGAPVPPRMVLLPKENSTLKRETAIVADGQVALRQVWEATDSLWNPEYLCGVEVSGLRERTRYVVSLKAHTVENSSAVVEVHGVDDEGILVPMDLSLVEVVPAEGWQEYEGAFSTGYLTTIRILTACYKLPDAGRNEVIWDDWRLHETGPAADVQPESLGLIENSSFEKWYAGKPLPEGSFTLPDPALGHSMIEPHMRRAQDGKYVLQQVWSASDADDAPERLFGVEVAGLKPDTEYRFSCQVEPMHKFTASVGVYGIDASGKMEALRDPLLEVKPDKFWWRKLEGVFNTGAYQKIKIVTRGPAKSGAFPNRVLWDDWRLVPAATGK